MKRRQSVLYITASFQYRPLTRQAIAAHRALWRRYELEEQAFVALRMSRDMYRGRQRPIDDGSPQQRALHLVLFVGGAWDRFGVTRRARGFLAQIISRSTAHLSQAAE